VAKHNIKKTINGQVMLNSLRKIHRKSVITLIPISPEKIHKQGLPKLT
jgi:hypothetical protein